MKKLLVELRQEHLDNGAPRNAGYCPIALAVKDALKKNRFRAKRTVLVSSYTILVLKDKDKKRVTSMPSVLSRFIYAFDFPWRDDDDQPSLKAVNENVPFEFEVEIP